MFGSDGALKHADTRSCSHTPGGNDSRRLSGRRRELKITTLDFTIKGYFLRMNVTQKCLLIVWPSLVRRKSRRDEPSQNFDRCSDRASSISAPHRADSSSGVTDFSTAVEARK